MLAPATERTAARSGSLSDLDASVKSDAFGVTDGWERGTPAGLELDITRVTVRQDRAAARPPAR
jgi:hypothetical protein